MVVYILSIRTELQGVESIELKPDADICISVRNPTDHNETREGVVIDRRDFEDSPDAVHFSKKKDGHPPPPVHHRQPKHSEAPCHFALKWQDAAQRSTIRVLDVDAVEAEPSKKSKKPSSQHAPPIAKKIFSDDSGKLIPILALECSDIEPFAFHPTGDEFVVTNSAGDKFETLDWNKNEWTSYDLSSGSTNIKILQVSFS
jgi:Eukaryotic protein of unknown function (DUF866)